MNINVVLEETAYMPEKAHTADAGFDIRTPELVCIPPHSKFNVDTGVHMEIPLGYVGFLKSKSGLNTKKGIVTEGVIDAEYTGSIKASIYNHSDSLVTFERGDKITQIVILPIPHVILNQVDELEETERGGNGFGSTGR